MTIPHLSAALALALFSSPAAARSEPDRGALQRDFEARYGSGWTFEWDGETGTPTAIFGPGAAVVAPGPLGDAQALELGQAILQANRDLLGAGPESFVP